MATNPSTPGVLIVFGSRYGQTEKIATRIADLIEENVPVELWRCGVAVTKHPLESYKGIMIGSAVYGGRHLKPVEAFIRRNLAILRGVPTAFFSVSGSAGGETEKERAQAQKQMEALLNGTGWSPGIRAAFGGALAFSSYNWFMRLIVRLIMKSQGQDVDGISDVEYTDWDVVDQFARDFANLLNAHSTVAPAA